jgi:aspartate aminotransferase
LNGDQRCIEPMVKAFRERHDYVIDALNRIPGVKCLESGGAFYAFPDFREAIKALHAKRLIQEGNDLALCEYLLKEAEVAVVPGSAFGAEGYIRISIATSMENLKKAIDRIEGALT